LYIPKPNLERGKDSLHYRGSVLSNKIPVEAREEESTEPSKCHSNFALNFKSEVVLVWSQQPSTKSMEKSRGKKLKGEKKVETEKIERKI